MQRTRPKGGLLPFGPQLFLIVNPLRGSGEVNSSLGLTILQEPLALLASYECKTAVELTDNVLRYQLVAVIRRHVELYFPAAFTRP